MTDPVTLTGSNINLPKSRRQGVEAGLKIHPHEWVDVLLNYTYTDARFRTSFDLLSGTVEKGDKVPLVPMHRVNGTVSFHPVQGFEVSLDGQYIGRQVLLNDEPNQSYSRIQDAFLLNAQASYTWKMFRVFLQANNLTDRKYETFGTLSGNTVFVMPAAGINVLGGLTVRFEGYY